MATLLAIVQQAATRMGIAVPSTLFANTDRTAVEIEEVLIEAGDKILRHVDWPQLRIVETHTGDGTTTEFAAPSDFLRMPKDADIWSTRWQAPMIRIEPEDWLHLTVRDFDGGVPNWTKYGGNFVYYPAMASDETGKFFYISNLVWTNTGGTNIATPTADTDTFRLDDRVLELMVIAEWRRVKGLDYSEEMQDAYQAMERYAIASAGAKILKQRSRLSTDAKIAFPFNVTA